MVDARTDRASLTKLALLIDGDNISSTYMRIIMREAERLGAVAVRRIYGQFKSGKMKSWLKHLQDYDLTAVNVSPLTHGKNATDMKLVIEAMDMLHGRQLDGFCIASSDGDFTPLAARIRGNALVVYGFGAEKAPAGYKAEFDRFFACDTMLKAEKADKKTAPRRAATPAQGAVTSPATKTAPARTTRNAAPKPAREITGAARVPVSELLAAIDRAKRTSGWSHLRDVGNELSRAGFSPAKNHFKVATLVKQHSSVVEIERRGSDTYLRGKIGAP